MKVVCLCVREHDVARYFYYSSFVKNCTHAVGIYRASEVTNIQKIKRMWLMHVFERESNYKVSVARFRPNNELRRRVPRLLLSVGCSRTLTVDEYSTPVRPSPVTVATRPRATQHDILLGEMKERPSCERSAVSGESATGRCRQACTAARRPPFQQLATVTLLSPAAAQCFIVVIGDGVACLRR